MPTLAQMFWELLCLPRKHWTPGDIALWYMIRGMERTRALALGRIFWNWLAWGYFPAGLIVGGYRSED